MYTLFDMFTGKETGEVVRLPINSGSPFFLFYFLLSFPEALNSVERLGFEFRQRLACSV